MRQPIVPVHLHSPRMGEPGPPHARVLTRRSAGQQLDDTDERAQRRFEEAMQDAAPATAQSSLMPIVAPLSPSPAVRASDIGDLFSMIERLMIGQGGKSASEVRITLRHDALPGVVVIVQSTGDGVFVIFDGTTDESMARLQRECPSWATQLAQRLARDVTLQVRGVRDASPAEFRGTPARRRK